MTECKECSGLHPLSFGFGFGITSAIFMFVYGILAWQFAWGVALVHTMGSLYIGYAATFPGSIVGAVWAFVLGFIFGFLLAFFYNSCMKCRCKKAPVTTTT